MNEQSHEASNYEEYSQLTIEQMARLLSESGEPITPEEVRENIQAGCPTNPDGTLSLVNYVAWLMKERRDG